MTDYNSDQEFFVYVLPISGGAIVCHLALLQEVFDARIKSNGGVKRGYFSYSPRLVFGSSGGNISAFIGLMSEWNSDAINRNVDFIRSDLFLDEWVPKEFSLIPSIPFAVINGTFYRQGVGAHDVFNSFFTQKSIQRTEIWSGTYDNKHQKAQFFCNKSQSDTYITQPFFNEEQQLYCSMPLKFVSGNVNKLADICVASGTIPTVVPSKVIDGIPYDDGGVMYPSPLSVLHKELLRIITGKERVAISRSFREEKNTEENEEFVYSERKTPNEKNLRLFYFYPYQPNDILSVGNKMDTGIRSYLDSILKVSMLQDRNAAIELLNTLCNGEIETETTIKMDNDELARNIEFLSNRKHYVLCLFPHGNPSLNIRHLNGPNIRAELGKIRQSYGCQIWYSKEMK